MKAVIKEYIYNLFYFGVNLLIIYIIRITQKKRTKNLMGGMCWRTPHTWETANTLRKVQVTKNREMQFQQKKSEKGNWREMVVPLLFCETSNTLLMSVSMVVATVRNTLHYGLELVHTWGMESLRRLRSPFCEKRFACFVVLHLLVIRACSGAATSTRWFCTPWDVPKNHTSHGSVADVTDLVALLR